MAEETGERSNREQGARPDGGHGGNGRRRHRGYRYSNNSVRFNGGRHEGGEQNPNRQSGIDSAQRQEGGRGAGNPGQHHNRRDNSENGSRSSGKGAPHVKAHETMEDIQKDILRIEKEIELEISEISAVKLGI